MVKYTEETFAGSNWTHFHEVSCRKRLTPFTHILVQAPRGVAEDVLRAFFGVDPNGSHCEEHGKDYGIYEDCTEPAYLLKQHGSIYIISADAIPYVIAGIWPKPAWVEAEK